MLDALGADVFTLVAYNTLGAVAENAGGMILVEDDIVALNKNLQCVAFCNVQSTAELNGKNDSSELIYLSYNTGRLHSISLFR